MRRKIISEIIVILYISLMLYTAIAKLKDYDITRERMAMMPLLEPIAHIVVWALPVLEMIIAVLLFIPRFRIRGLYMVTTLMLFFSIYVVFMMIFYEHLPCSCGGLIEQLSWSGHLVFNGIFIGLGIISIKMLKAKVHNQNNAPVIS